MENNIHSELEFLMNPELYQKYIDSKENVFLWPNPAGNTIHIQGAKAFNTLAVYDMVGKLI